MKLIKFGVAIGFIVAFCMLVDFQTLMDALRKVSWLWFVGVLAVVFAIRVLMSLRWKVLLQSKGIDITFAESLYVNLLGHSLGFISPGGVGADIVRGHSAFKKSKDVVVAANVLAIDRLIGVFTMLLLALLSTSILYLLDVSASKITLTVLVFSALCLLAFPCGRGVILRLRDSEYLKKFLRGKKRVLFEKLLAIFDSKFLSNRALSRIFLVSMAMQLTRVFLFLALFASLNVTVPFLFVLAFTPIVFIVMLLPLSFGGIGLREGALFMLFQEVGVTFEQSLAVGLLFYAAQVLMVLPGIVLYLLGSIKKHADVSV